MHYGCQCPKPLQVRSSWPSIGQLDMGKLTKKEREEKTTLKTASLKPNFITVSWQGMGFDLLFWNEVARVSSGQEQKS